MHTLRSSWSRRGGRAAALLVLAASAACADGPLDPAPTPGASTAVASVEITPGTVQLPVGGTRGLSALPRARDGRSLSGKSIQWKSSDETVVRVDLSGNVTALREGTITVTATSEGKQGQARIQVTPPPPPPAVAWIRISGGEVEMEPGETRRLTATHYAADGTVLSGRETTWSGSDSTVIRIRPDGTAYGLKGGTVTITASSEGKTGQTTLRIPDWLEFDLHSLDGEGLPVVIELSSDTTREAEHLTTIRERRVRLVGGTIRLSTLDWRYRQSYELQIWDRKVSIYHGDVVYADEEELTGTRWISDHGEATEFNMWTGEPIYHSSVFEGHAFGVNRPVEGGRSIRQPLPGEGPQAYWLVYRK